MLGFGFWVATRRSFETRLIYAGATDEAARGVGLPKRIFCTFGYSLDTKVQKYKKSTKINSTSSYVCAMSRAQYQRESVRASVRATRERSARYARCYCMTSLVYLGTRIKYVEDFFVLHFVLRAFRLCTFGEPYPHPTRTAAAPHQQRNRQPDRSSANVTT